MFWMLLVMAVFAVMRWSAWSGRRPHPYQGYGAPGPYDQPGSPPGLGPVTAEQIPRERCDRTVPLAGRVERGPRRREHET